MYNCTRILELRNKLTRLTCEQMIVVSKSTQGCTSETFTFGRLISVGKNTLTLNNPAGCSTEIYLCDVIFFIYIPSVYLGNTCCRIALERNSNTQSTGQIPIGFVALPFSEENQPSNITL